ncbi:MAG: carbonic anhydrase [Bifidobacteriaceae bacterium]|nr:carbonic anhydrase [Bifidobacteriaceae bacterium]
MEGNQRFAGGTSTQRHPHQDAARRDDLVGGQHPRAVVLGCSDSRAATEIVFDQGLGDLFTVRTAGEILDTAVLASLDFAVEGLGVPLLFVLGHENCGTIAATKQTLTGTPEGNVSVGGSQSAILEQVGLSIRTALNNGANTADTAAFERTHALRIASEILTRSRVIRTAVAQNRLGIAVGRYMITTGAVELLN